MKNFADSLIKEIKKKKSHVVVGLDPDYDKLPQCLIKASVASMKGIGAAITEFNCELIDAVYEFVPAVKPQIAFFERYGIEGIKAFVETIEYAKRKGLIVIEDAKRNDIGSTAIAYSEGHIGKVKLATHNVAIFDVDAITVNPYFGADGINPFLSDVSKYGKGIFVLVKTSNQSSKDLQDLEVLDKGKRLKLYEMVARLVDKWGSNSVGNSTYSSVGAVVGATFPKEAKRLRKLMPHAYFLVPGYGAQGGKAVDIVNFFNKDGYGALIAASRSINYAFKNGRIFKDSEFAQAARGAVIQMNTEINDELQKTGLLQW
jgi:orotidine-5'-phosphate decarboxylase